MGYNELNSIDFNLIEGWYSNKGVKIALIKNLKNRELALLVPKHYPNEKARSVRNIRCHNFGVKENGDKFGLDYVYDVTGFFKIQTHYNFYYSLAEYKNGLPYKQPRLSDRDNDEWNNNHWKEMIGYDWLIDIDSPSFEDLSFAYHSAVNLKNLFDLTDVPYYLRFSGCGFHFIVPYRLLPKHLSFNYQDSDNIYKFLHKLTKILYNNISELIDLNIYDSRRVTKLPYSLAVYGNEILVCHPFLSDEEFNSFYNDKYVIWPSIYKLRPQNYSYQVGNRGEHLFNKDGSMRNFYKRYNIKEVVE
ncbi:MAG: hypothetical protein PHQ60_16245 [Sideroxydans sp.]|nr:hypothetical protein [Sideroxydans sp.]